jgi:hypothetical protein
MTRLCQLLYRLFCRFLSRDDAALLIALSVRLSPSLERRSRLVSCCVSQAGTTCYVAMQSIRDSERLTELDLLSSNAIHSRQRLTELDCTFVSVR